MSKNRYHNFLNIEKIKKVLRPRFSFHYISYGILISFIAFSVVGIVTATTPNPGHPWAEVGDGVFAVTNNQTATRTYTFPDANATVLTTANLVTIAQGGTNASSFTGNGVVVANAGGTALTSVINATGSTLCLTQVSSGVPTWGTCGGVTDGDKGDIVVSGSGATWSIDADVIDWADISDSMTLDATTDIALNSNTLRFNGATNNFLEITPTYIWHSNYVSATNYSTFSSSIAGGLNWKVVYATGNQTKFNGNDGTMQMFSSKSGKMGDINWSYTDGWSFYDTDGKYIFELINNTSNRLVGQSSTTGGIGYVTLGSGLSLSSGVLSATGGSRLDQITAANTSASIDSLNNPITWAWSTATTQTPLSLTADGLTTGSIFSLSSNGTAALTGQKGLNISLSGANGTAGQTTYAGYLSNTHTGSGTNVGLYATASGGTNNYAAIFENGNVGIGTTNPTVAKLVISTTGTANNLNLDSTGSGVTGLSLSTSGVVKGYWAVPRNSSEYFTDSLAGDMVFRSESNKILFGQGSGSSTMTISAGNVGMGANSPTARLHVIGADGSGAAAPSVLTVLGGTGASTYAGGAISLTAGIGGGTSIGTSGAGGAFNIAAGSGGSGSGGSGSGGAGGNLTLSAGAGGSGAGFSGSSGSGGSVSIISGNAGATVSGAPGNGGSISLTAGDGSTDNGGNGGNIVLNPGAAPSGTIGKMIFGNVRGNVTIGSTTATSLFNVGTAAQFRVNSSGAIAAATGIISSGTIQFSSLTTNGALYTSGGNGTLTSTAPTSGAIGYWSRTGTTLSPATANDIVSVSTNSTTASNKAIEGLQTGATSGTDYAGYFSNTGAATTNVGLYATASGGTNNYAIHSDGILRLTDINIQRIGSGSVSIGGGTPNVTNSFFFGANAGTNATNASLSNFLGGAAGFGGTNASYSNFLGFYAGANAANATSSNFFGYGAGSDVDDVYSQTDASFSNFFGFKAGSSSGGDILGSNNIIIGTNITLPNATSNALNIGGVLFGTGTYSTTTGNPSITAVSTGKIGIGIVSPAYRLDVLNANTAQTASNRVANFSNAGATFDTTAGALSSYGGYFSSTSTRSSGANDLTNIGLYATASGADNNYAAIFENGNVGIGTTAPALKFDTRGYAGVMSSGTTYPTGINLNNPSTFYVVHQNNNQGLTIANPANNTSGAYLTFYKTRGVDAGTKTALVAGDTLGTIGFFGVSTDGSAELGARIQAQAESVNTSSIGGRLVFHTINTSGVFGERMRLTADGNLNIGGNTSPTGMLSVGSTSQFQVNSSGAIAAATGITSSGTINFSGLSASSAVYTDASKNLTTTAPTSGTIGYWSRTGTTLSPATANDIISISTNSTTVNNKAIEGIQTGATAGTDYAGYFSNTGAATTNVGLYATASGGTNNYAIHSDGILRLTDINIQRIGSGSVSIGGGTPNVTNSFFFGTNAGTNATNASLSNFLGGSAGFGGTNASYSNFLGFYAGANAANATSSNFFGYGAGSDVDDVYSQTDASFSNFFGFKAGSSSGGDILGSNNVIIGTNITLPNATSNALNIGGVLFGSGTYSTTTGNPSITAVSTGKIGVGIVSPAYRLDVLNANTAQTATNRVANFSNAGATFDTTAGNLSSYGGYFSSTSTESAGGNVLTNVGLYATASGADVNYAAIFDAGNVGIGTTTPRVKLELGGDGAILATGTFGSGWTESDLGTGARMLWYPRKGAFRAGWIDGAQWNNANIGNESVAFNNSTTASGSGSVALNELTVASGTDSLAAGIESVSSGDFSSALGVGTIAGSYGLTAIGRYNIGSGTAGSWVSTDSVFEVGIGATSGSRANALTILKNGNVGIGDASPDALFSVGATSQFQVNSSGNILGVFANATTDTDRFLVSDTGTIKYRTGAEILSDIGAQASGNYITALTGDITATGPGSVAATIANDVIDWADISDTMTLDAATSVALDSKKLSFTQGGAPEFLVLDPTAGSERAYLAAYNPTGFGNYGSFEANGSNTSATFSSSAFFNDGDTTASIFGSADVTSSVLQYSADTNEFNGSIIATGTFGSGWIEPGLGAGVRTFWYPRKAALRSGEATGSEWNDANIGDYSIALGQGVLASGANSLALGYITDATGIYSTALGVDTTASNNGSIAMGNSTVASGHTSSSFGHTTTASGDLSTSFGYSTKAESYESFAIGQFNIGGGTADSWVSTDRLFEIGIGAHSLAKANALTVLKNGSVGIGDATPDSLFTVGSTSQFQVNSSGNILGVFANATTDTDRFLVSDSGTIKYRTGAELLSDIGAGTGTVTNTGGSLTSNAVVLGAGTNDTKVVAGITTNGTAQLILGVNATTLGTLKMFGNTSGDVTLQPTAAAGTATTQTLPATSGTLVNRVTTANGVSASNSDGALSFTLGTITPTTTNGLTITANGTNTLNIAAGKTLTVSNSLTLAGTDSTTMTFPSTSATIARTDAGQTFTGTQTFSGLIQANLGLTSATGQSITASNFGVEFTESDTNPTCAAGNFTIYADLSENKLKKCQNGTVADLDTTGGGGLSDADYGDIVVSGSGTAMAIDADVIDWADISDTTTLDNTTSIAFGASTLGLTFTNDGSGNELHNLTSTGDFLIQDNGVNALSVDDSGNVILGQASTDTGQLVFANASNANTVTLQAGATSGSYTWTLPTADSAGCLASNGSGQLSIQTCGDVNYTTFTSNTTFTKKSGVKSIIIEAVGGGGSGGGGQAAAVATYRGGGGGGGAGAYVTKTFDGASFTSSAVNIQAPAAVTGGASGTNGTAGGKACISTNASCAGTVFLQAYGGGFGARGGITANTGAGGGGGGGAGAVGANSGGTTGGAGGGPNNGAANASAAGTFGGGGGGTSSANTVNAGNGGGAQFGGGGGGASQGNGTANASGNGGSSIFGGGGGGAGGSIIGNNAVSNGGTGGTSGAAQNMVAGGGGTAGTSGASSTAGGAGRNSADANSSGTAGYGGGGGGSNNSAASTGSNGGNGGNPGGGGGGGGGGVTGGAGGAGGRSEVRIVEVRGASGADLGEFYSTNDPLIEAADVVSFDSELKSGVKMSDKSYDQNAAGVISTQPDVVMGAGLLQEGVKSVVLALAGRVPVKVTAMNGVIKPGDYLTTSTVPGWAMKATKAGHVIGQALTGWDPEVDDPSVSPERMGVVILFVQPGYYNGESLFTTLDKVEGLTTDETIAPTDLSKKILTKLLSDLPSAYPQTPTIDVKSNTVNMSDIYSDRFIAALEIITPKVTTNKLLVDNIYAAVGTNVGLILNENGKFIINKENNTEQNSTLNQDSSTPVITFDSLGNATFAGTITAKELKVGDISGIQAITDEINNLAQGQEAFTLTASVMNTLSGALTIAQADINKLKEELANTQTIITGLSLANADIDNRLKVVENIFNTELVFNNKTEFIVPPLFNKDSVGYALIKQGDRRAKITFFEPYIATPAINTSITFEDTDNVGDKEAKVLFDEDVRYIIIGKDKTGFTILLNKKAPRDIRFSWNAFSVKDSNIFESVIEGLEIEQLEVDSLPSPNTNIEVNDNTKGNESTIVCTEPQILNIETNTCVNQQEILPEQIEQHIDEPIDEALKQDVPEVEIIPTLDQSTTEAI